MLLSCSAGEEDRRQAQRAVEDRRRARRRRRLRRLQRRREAARQRGQLGQDVLLGAGFPLLFGGGPGSIAGGLVGALAGQGKGGFGAQVAGSAIGQVIDQTIQSAVQLGQALNPLTLDLEALAGAAGLAGTSTEKLLKKVQEVPVRLSRSAADQLL